MDKSARRFRRTAIVVICSVIAVLGLLLLGSAPDSVSNQSQGTVRPPETAGSQGSQPGARFAAGGAENARTNEVSHADLTDRPQRDTAPDPGIATLDENVWLSRPHSSTFDRFEAISALGDSRDAMAELTLVDLLNDQDPAIRESAVESLASLGTNGAIQALGFALTDANPLVRRTALEFLAEIGTRDALQALATTLTDPDVDVRLAAVYELADTESAAVSALLQQFLADTDPSVRQLAAEFLND